MRKFFPNLETAVIFIFIIAVGLWGISRCKKKKDEATLRTATEVTVNPLDTLSSPAATKRRIATTPTTDPITQTPLPPQYQQPNTQLPTTPTNTPTLQTQPANVPQSYSTTVTSPAATRVPMPSSAPVVNSKGVTTTPQTSTTTTPPPSNTMLYVLINGLNIRSKPELKAKVKGKLKLHDQVYFLDEVTEQAQTVRLANGTSVTKPWFKIQTKRGTVGWVHGSGVDFYKRKPTDGL
ncbi:MAG: SH3 domain-containing protein [Saprospiraceae bacterium]|nr:SH3 domain-containing protein [Saprospiraceae bacterium]